MKQHFINLGLMKNRLFTSMQYRSNITALRKPSISCFDPQWKPSLSDSIKVKKKDLGQWSRNAPLWLWYVWYGHYGQHGTVAAGRVT